MSQRIALFPGTFDPVTHGHVDLVRRGLALFDRVVVGVVADQGKPLFPAADRVRLLEQVLAAEGLAEGRRVAVVPFQGLVVAAAKTHGAICLLRGIRGALDWDYEMRMAFANRDLAPDIDTIFLPPSATTAPISASLVREVARLGGAVDAWVHPLVVEALRARLRAAGGRDEPPAKG